MRKLLAVLALASLVFGRPVAGGAQTQAAEFGLAIGAAAANLLYTPAKIVVAGGGLAVGALTGLLTGGDVRAAYGVWVPTASGTYLLRPAHLDGSEPIEFFGSDYADRPSTASAAAEGAAGVYDAMYSR